MKPISWVRVRLHPLCAIEVQQAQLIQQAMNDCGSQNSPEVKYPGFYNYLIGYTMMFHPDGRVSLYLKCYGYKLIIHWNHHIKDFPKSLTSIWLCLEDTGMTSSGKLKFYFSVVEQKHSVKEVTMHDVASLTKLILGTKETIAGFREGLEAFSQVA